LFEEMKHLRPDKLKLGDYHASGKPSKGKRMTIIAISRFTGSGGERLAKCLSEELSIPAVSREVITQVANQFGITEAVLWQQLEKTKGLFSGPSPERRLYLAALQLVLAKKAQEGPFVYHGLAGHFLLKGIPQILKVGIVAPLEYRARKLMEQKNISLEEAIRSTQRWDERRSNWVRFLYNVEWLDPSLYDLVINIAHLSVESACRVVMCALKQEEFGELPETQGRINDFVLASTVKFLLATDERTKGLELEVEAKKGVVRITGRIPTSGIFSWQGKESTRNDLYEVAKTAQGVQKLLVSLEGTAIPLE
jgi:cytidylate kinase